MEQREQSASTTQQTPSTDEQVHTQAGAAQVPPTPPAPPSAQQQAAAPVGVPAQLVQPQYAAPSGGGYGAGGPAGWAPYAPQPPARRSTSWLMLVVGVLVGLAIAAVVVFSVNAFSSSAATGRTPSGSGSQGQYGQGSQNSQGGSSAQGTSQQVQTATDEQERGVALIETTLGYEDAEAAGTGIVLSSDGLVLTNHHVIESATEIQVTIASTGTAYQAAVVGYDDAQDVALLQLDGASGLETAQLDDDGVTEAEAVTAIGNAEGRGILVAADGTVTATDQSITTQGDSGESESLSGLIELDAEVVSGDSGGPVIDADGEVIGMTVAASSGSTDVTGYAIPIDTVTAVVEQIQAGDETSTLHIGENAFLGVEISSSQSTTGGQTGRGRQQSTTTVQGATVGGVIDGTPAATAGLVAGDVITAVNGTTITSAEELSDDLAQREPGEQVRITYTDTAGTGHTVTVTLIAGPVG